MTETTGCSAVKRATGQHPEKRGKVKLHTPVSIDDFPMPIATVQRAGVTDLKITSNDDCSRMSSHSKMKISVIFYGGVK